MSESINGRGRRSVFVKTANYTVIAGTNNGALFTNEGAAAAITFALPAATVGQWYAFFVKAAQELRIDPNGTETIALGSTGVQGAAGKYLTSTTVGHSCEIVCVKAGEWCHQSLQVGTFTQEA